MASSYTMNADIKEAFSRIKPVCDVVMVCPSPESIAAFIGRVSEMKKEAVQELQQYILFPFITHIKSKEIEKKPEMQWRMADGMRAVLEKVTVTSFEMCMKIETGLLSLIFDNSKAGMIADVSEELKLSVMKCLTALMVNLDKGVLEKFLRTQVPVLAQTVFVSVHLAKLEKLRALRLSAINCLTAHTATHAKMTDDKYQVTSPALEAPAVEMLSNILPGVLAALQDVAMCSENQGHAVLVAALDAIHRIVCITMHDKYITQSEQVSAEDFAKMMQEKVSLTDREVSSKAKDPKDIPKRSPEWFAMAGEKLVLVTRSLVTLTSHEHYKVRKELAIFCSRLLSECNKSMQPSVPVALDGLIIMSKDEYPEVAQLSAGAVRAHLARARAAGPALQAVSDNLFITFTSLPRVLNNIETRHKLTALNLVNGYIQILCNTTRPQRLTSALTVHNNMQCACNALHEACAVCPVTSLAQHATRDVTSPPPTGSPWCKLRLLDAECEGRLRETCRLLGDAECAELVLDCLLEMFQQRRDCETVLIMNWMGSAPNSSQSLVTRILNTYIEESVWYLPLELGRGEAPLTSRDTRDVSVYDPRAWRRDSVPDLYEGTTETRYTDISYQAPRVLHKDPHTCATLAEAQKNLLLSCLLTEGVGVMARRLMANYQPYLMKTLCLILERVGSKYELLHLAGLKAINDVALACGHGTVAHLIRRNADYFTAQVTLRLKKAWNSQSALQILSVVMEYSDPSIHDCLYGIVEDVLVQSCDKYHEKNLQSYLQVFLTFIECIRKWFPPENTKPDENNSENNEIDVLKDVIEYVRNEEVAERLLSNEEFEKEAGKSVEEMYQEDLKEKQDNPLDYDDRVTEVPPPLPQHIKVTVTILKRTLNFVTSKNRDESILALRILTLGLPTLAAHEDELLPLVHQAWAPAVTRLDCEVAIMKPALDLLIVMAEYSKEFLRDRAVKQVFPRVYKYLRSAAADSLLKDAGSWYRSSAAFSLQVSALAALPRLVQSLQLGDEVLDAMASVDAYLSRKQPKPLQALAVEFFKAMLEYDHGAAWQHLHALCANELALRAPAADFLCLARVAGTPSQPRDKDLHHNINLIFNRVS